MARPARGFSLLELVVAMTLTTTVVACVFAALQPAQGALAVVPETADMQQRLRVAVDALTRDLAAAGAGAYIGERAGPLLHYFAPVLPGPSDTITVLSVPATAAQTTLAADLMPEDDEVHAVAEPGCPAGTNLCGFAAGQTVAVYDDSGAVGLFTVAAVADAAARLTLASRPAGSGGTTYRAGSNLVEVRVDTYSLKSDAASQTFQLMRADGSGGAAVPVVDHVVGLAFDYYGEPRPPSLAEGQASYGPSPPPGGENCVFAIDPVSGEQTPRLDAMAEGTALVPLTAAQLADGPWCPDETNPNRWDADLLRIRRIGVTIRLEPASAALRGPAGVLEIRFQVSPRNINLGRP